MGYIFRLTHSRRQAGYKNKEEIFTNSRVWVLELSRTQALPSRHNELYWTQALPSRHNELYRTQALPSRHNARKDSSQLAALVIAHYIVAIFATSPKYQPCAQNEGHTFSKFPALLRVFLVPGFCSHTWVNLLLFWQLCWGPVSQ